MANLDYESFTESIRTILKLRDSQDSAIVKEIVEASVRDLIEEFDSDIGSRTDFELTVEDVTEGSQTFSRIYLPDDAHYVREVWVGDNLVQPIDVTDSKFWSDYQSYLVGPTILQAFIGRSEFGKLYIQFPYQLSVSSDVVIRVDYRLHSSDITYIPEAYKNLVIYASIRHYRNWYDIDNEVAQSKAEASYNKYLARMRADIGNQVMNKKLDYEVEWKKMFRYLLEGSTNPSINIRYSGGL